jgi:hypothetical protein
MLTLSALNWLYHGGTGKLLVGRLTPAIASLLDARTLLVHINAATLRHIIDEKPRQIAISDVLLLTRMISDGWLVRESARRKSFVISYQSPKRQLKAAFKIAAGGEEIWVSTLHQSSARQTKALLKRGMVIRTHK